MGATLALFPVPDQPLPMPASPSPPQRSDRTVRLVAGLLILAAVLLVVTLVAGRIRDDDPRPEATAAKGTSSPVDDQMPTSTIPPRPTPPPEGTTPNPDSLLVLVDHERPLPDEYVPGDLVLLDVPFTFEAIDPRRFLRREASEALNELFAAAEADELPLLGVSGFRSAETQAQLFDDYAAQDGMDAANRYSARPGHSEHQTGLAMDVVGSEGICPTEACFADQPETEWLADHAHEHGFIVRYPAGGEASTGYLYEPWHLRYVGLEVAAEIHGNGRTLEQHLGLP
ncbi:MAG: M15 family metallopeptidase [Aquihabitans sp.]